MHDKILEIQHVLNCLGWFWIGGDYKDNNSLLVVRCKTCRHEVTGAFRHRKSRFGPCIRCRQSEIIKPATKAENLTDNYIAQKIAEIGYILTSILSRAGQSSKLEIKCVKCDATKVVSFISVVRHTKCKNCILLSIRKTQENLILKKMPGHSVVYADSYTAMQVTCPQGHPFTFHPAVVKRSKPGKIFCPECLNQIKIKEKHDLFLQELTDYGWDFLSGQYETPSSRFIIACKKGHSKEVVYRQRMKYISPGLAHGGP